MELEQLKVTVNGRVYNISIGELGVDLPNKRISFTVKSYDRAPQAAHWQAGAFANRKAPFLVR
ncbi:MAG TPA: hypothetical protein PLE79_07770 [Clostridia bacterium]|nr:MAG: hypothetical protein BWY62_00369 [Firmicutes bacterium ADurb.Bin356]HOF95421.1 hypothetical protein [Clostridia bacterium]